MALEKLAAKLVSAHVYLNLYLIDLHGTLLSLMKGTEDFTDTEAEKVKEPEDDGWQHYFDEKSQKFFFYNKISKVKQWINPRVSKDDECNQGLPAFDPPKLPFEEESSYEQQLRELREDPKFKELSTFEKYKHVESLKRKLENEERESSGDQKDSNLVDLKKDLEDIKPFKENTNFTDYGSKSMYAQELNHSIMSINNGQKNKPQKITKKQIKSFNDKKKERREAKLKKWLNED